MAKLILIVEDEQDHRDLLRLLFGIHGYRVETAADADEALEKLGSLDPDLLIVDVMLPGMDGWELCDLVKKGGAKYPVLMLSASADMQQRFEESNADDMMTKPFESDELLARARHLLGE